MAEKKNLGTEVEHVFTVQCRGRGPAQSFIFSYGEGVSVDVTLEISGGAFEMANNCRYRSGAPFVGCLFNAEGFRGVCPYCGIFPSRFDELMKALSKGGD